MEQSDQRILGQFFLSNIAGFNVKNNCLNKRFFFDKYFNNAARTNITT
jgi:hypothetical protein